jgi:adenosine deaminase/aminodeoxyfutalosine deaminase
MYEYSDFLGFLRSYKEINLRLALPEHFALITRRLLERLERENARYAELTISVGVWLWRGLEFQPAFDAIATEAARASFPVRYIFDATRQFGAEPAWEVARLAAAMRERGVVAFGIGGDEAHTRATAFREVFAWCRRQGLRLSPHAGEVTTAQSVWDALECGADRIGHGIRAIDDPVLVKHLRDHQILLELCPTSNVRTGAVATLDEHPLRRLYDAGVPLTLNSDDPPMFGTTLLNEYRVAAAQFGFTPEQLRRIARHGFLHAFDPIAREVLQSTPLRARDANIE